MIEKSAATAPTGNQQVALASSAASVIVRRCYCSRRVAASAEGMAVEKVSRGARNFGGSLLAKCGGFAEASTPSLLKVIFINCVQQNAVSYTNACLSAQRLSYAQIRIFTGGHTFNTTFRWTNSASTTANQYSHSGGAA